MPFISKRLIAIGLNVTLILFFANIVFAQEPSKKQSFIQKTKSRIASTYEKISNQGVEAAETRLLKLIHYAKQAFKKITLP